MRARLTDTLAATLAPPASGKSHLIVWDTHPKAPTGFGLRITAAGARSYILNYRRRSDGTERRFTIGDLMTRLVAEARVRAAKLRRIVEDGGDPLGELQAGRAALTVAEVVEKFIAEALHKRAPSTRAEYARMLRGHVVPEIGALKPDAVTRSNLKKLHEKITEGGPRPRLRRANAVLTVAGVFFAWAINNQYRTLATNPAHGYERNPEVERKRYLTAAELTRLVDVWEQERPTRRDSVDILRLLLMTGARRAEVATARWSDFDLDLGRWLKPRSTTKQGRDHGIPLSPDALAVLRQRRAEDEAATVRPMHPGRQGVSGRDGPLGTAPARLGGDSPSRWSRQFPRSRPPAQLR